MPRERTVRRYRYCYRWLLRLYPEQHRARFGEGMEQTFSDLLHARADEGKVLLGLAAWMFVETFAVLLREKLSQMLKSHKRIFVGVITILFLLLLPLVAMQFTDEVVWSASDFLLAAILLFGAGAAVEILMRVSPDNAYRAGAGLAVGSTLFLIWSNLAVGLIGSENNPANAMYFAVVAVGFLGALIARVQARGMALTLFSMALAQISIAIIALLAGMQHYPESSVIEIVNVNGFFVVLFLGAAILFRNASLAGTKPMPERD